MSNPNLNSISAIYGKLSTTNSLATSLSTILSAVATNTIYKINTIFATNIGSLSASVDIAVNDTSNDVYIIKDIIVPVGSTQIILSKESYMYLPEGYSLKSKSDTASSIALTISYEELT